MSFQEMKVAELREVAEEFGVDLDGKGSKNLILAAFVEDGVTWDMYEATHPKVEEDDEDGSDDDDIVVEKPKAKDKKPKKNQVLVRMSRDNGTYESQGYRWTREHPFALVDEDDFEWIIENEEGFRQATPKEAGEYYS